MRCIVVIRHLVFIGKNGMNKQSKKNTVISSSRPSGIAYLVGRLDHVLKRGIRNCLRPYGVTPAQYTALSIFRVHEQLSNAQLAERSMVSPQSANEMVKIMEKRGWILRQIAKTQGRIIPIQLTPAGFDLLEKCDQQVAKLETAMLATLSNSNKHDLQNHLRKMIRNLNQ